MVFPISVVSYQLYFTCLVINKDMVNVLSKIQHHVVQPSRKKCLGRSVLSVLVAQTPLLLNTGPKLFVIWYY